MSQHGPNDTSEQMTPEEVEETRHTPTSPEAYPGGDGDGEMTDDIHPEEWDNDWRPSDEAALKNPPTE